jgi:hypothetical protein
MADTDWKITFLEKNIKESKESRFVYQRIREGKKAYIYIRKMIRHKTIKKFNKIWL